MDMTDNTHELIFPAAINEILITITMQVASIGTLRSPWVECESK